MHCNSLTIYKLEKSRSKDAGILTETVATAEPTLSTKPISNPISNKPTNRSTSHQTTKKPFKPKHAWLTEAADDFLRKKIEEENKKPIEIEPLAKMKLSSLIRKKFTAEEAIDRKNVYDQRLNDYDERNCIKVR